MAKPLVPPDLLKAIAAVSDKVQEPLTPGGAKRPEASPRSGATEKQSIRRERPSPICAGAIKASDLNSRTAEVRKW
jgi:hypothetical protein